MSSWPGKLNFWQRFATTSVMLVAIVFGVITMLMIIPGPSNRLAPWRGVMLLATYGIYVITLLRVHSGA